MPIKPNDSAGEPITVTTGTTIEIHASSPNWFAVWVRSRQHITTLYLTRTQLHALRLQIDATLAGSKPPDSRPEALEELVEVDLDPVPDEPRDDWSTKR
jgi:hypothetical protein